MLNLLKIIFAWFVLYSLTANAQRNVDSLKHVLRNVKDDLERAKVLNELAETADEGEWQKFNEELYQISEVNIKKSKSGELVLWEKYYANSCTNKGLAEQNAGRPESAIKFNKLAYQIHYKNKNAEGIANAASNLGFAYQIVGNIPLAIEYLTEARKLSEDLNNKFGEAHILNSLGYISDLVKDTSKARQYYEHSARLRNEIGDSAGLAQSYSNLGVLHQHASRYEEARQYYEKSLKIRANTGDLNGIAVCYNNLGSLMLQHNKLQESINYFDKAQDLAEEAENGEELIVSLQNLGKAFFLMNKIIKAEDYASRSLVFAKAAGNTEQIMDASELLYKIYKKKGNSFEALTMYREFVRMKDSINNERSRRSVISGQFKYEYEKKAQTDSIKNAEAQFVKQAQLNAQEAQLKQDRIQRYGLLAGMALMLGSLAFVLSRYRLTQKQKRLIETQKLMVDHAYESLAEKNKEVMDSIKYAKRIQTALVTSEKYIDKQLSRLRK